MCLPSVDKCDTSGVFYSIHMWQVGCERPVLLESVSHTDVLFLRAEASNWLPRNHSMCKMLKKKKKQNADWWIISIIYLIENTENTLQPEIELYINTVCTTFGQLSVSG